MGYIYQKNTGIDLAYHQAQKKIGTEVEIYIDPSDPEKYFCPADVKMYRMTQICLLCCGWLAIVGTPIAFFILFRVIDCDDPRRWGRILFGLSGGKGETALD